MLYMLFLTQNIDYVSLKKLDEKFIHHSKLLPDTNYIPNVRLYYKYLLLYLNYWCTISRICKIVLIILFSHYKVLCQSGYLN